MHYALTDKELSEFIALLMSADESETSYASFILQVLKETHWEIKKLLAIIESGMRGKQPAVSRGLTAYLIRTLKESIILADFSSVSNIKEINISRVTTEQRYKLAHIDRNNILRTLAKYNINNQ